MSIAAFFQSDDWKTEKHVPVIECADTVPSDEFFELKVSLGKEIAHPNTTEHHIRWIRVYFKPQGIKQVPCHIELVPSSLGERVCELGHATAQTQKRAARPCIVLHYCAARFFWCAGLHLMD